MCDVLDKSTYGSIGDVRVIEDQFFFISSESSDVYVWEGGEPHCISRYFRFLKGVVRRRGKC